MTYTCACGHKVVIIRDEDGTHWEHGGFGMSCDYRHQRNCAECNCKNPKDHSEGVSLIDLLLKAGQHGNIALR